MASGRVSLLWISNIIFIRWSSEVLSHGANYLSYYWHYHYRFSEGKKNLYVSEFVRNEFLLEHKIVKAVSYFDVVKTLVIVYIAKAYCDWIPAGRIKVSGW